MKNINREIALNIVAIKELLELDEKDRKGFLEESFSYDELPIPNNLNSVNFDKRLINFLIERNLNITNNYLSTLLTNIFRQKIKVVGDSKELYKCPCCNYLTLERRGEYDICLVCFWEDDGNEDAEKYSSTNQMILKEGQNNFEKYGACTKNAINFVDKDGIYKYLYAPFPLISS